MSTRPTYTPPLPPLGPPSAPTPPAPLPALTAAEKARHVGAFLGGSSGGGLVVYLVAQGLRYSVLGWGEAGLLVCIGGPAALCTCVWALLPLYREWHASRQAAAWTQDQLHYYGRHYETLLDAQKAHTKAVYRGKKEPEATINRPAPPAAPVVTAVSTPPAPPPAETPTWADRARRVVETFRAPAPRVADPPPAPAPVDPGTTQRLPELPPGDRWRYQPTTPYTDSLRALVSVALATGTCSQDQAKACGIERRAFERLRDTLAAAEVFAPGPPGKPWQLSERVQRLRYDNADAEIHVWVARRLAE